MKELRILAVFFTLFTLLNLASCTGCRQQHINRAEGEEPESYDDPAVNDDLLAALAPPTPEEKKIYDDLCRFIEQENLDSLQYLFKKQTIDLSAYDKDKRHYNPILYIAAWDGNTDIIKFLIGKGADPKARTSGNETPLHRVAWRGNMPAVKLLVKHGAELNVIYKANGGLSPLCCAAESGEIDVVKYLISKGANPRYEHPESGASPLRSAAYYGYTDIFRLLASYLPSDYDWQEALFYSLIGGEPEIVNYVVEEKGAKVNRKSAIWDVYPIEKAAADRYAYHPNSRPVEVVKYLRKKGARLTDINEGRVMEWAIRHCSDEMMGYLLEQGIKIELPEPDGDWTHIAKALDDGNYVLARHLIRQTDDHTFRGAPLVVYFVDGLHDVPHIIKLLIEEGVNKPHYTEALWNCVSSGDSLSIELLLAAGADIRATDSTGANLLHRAQHYPIARLLIEKGADIRNPVMLGHACENPPLLWALEEAGIEPPLLQNQMNRALADAALTGDVRTLQYMLKRGAEVNSAATPLIKNAMQGYWCCSCDDEGQYVSYGRDKKRQVSPHIAALLLTAGADPDKVDEDGRTALHYVSFHQRCRLGFDPIPMGSRQERERGVHGDPAPPPKQYHDSIARLLIDHKAKLNIRDRNGDTPLILAAQSANHTVMKMLLDARADVKIKNKQGKNVFSYLSDPASLQVIHEAGLSAHIPKRLLNTIFQKFFTEQAGYIDRPVEQLRILIGYGADVNTRVYEKSALFYTLRSLYVDADDKYQIAQLLIDNGISLYAEDNRGLTLPMLLIKEMSPNEEYSRKRTLADLNFLIKNNIDLSHRSSDQFTMLGVALCEDRKEVAELLFSQGVQRDRRSEWWYLLRERHGYHDTLSKLRQLVLEGVDVDLQTPTALFHYTLKVRQPGITALMIYAAYGDADGVKAMLDMGANVNLRASDGTTALQVARDMRKKEIIDILIKAGAK